jgi:uncharacterized repeat protein (TIGR03847 family)
VRQVFEFDPPERFVVGTVGEPGQRTFFLQARGSGQLTTVALEKQQVAVLAERLNALLDEVLRRTAGDAAVPAAVPEELDDRDPLEQPIDEEFRVGTLTLGWDGEAGRVVVEAFEIAEEDTDETAEEPEAPAADDPDDERRMLVVRMSGGMARAFAHRALAVVAAGRPPCPLCGQPLDPEGHICPRQNGYRRRG